MSSNLSVYAQYFWDLNEEALKETEKILRAPSHPKFLLRMTALLSRCQKPKELFALMDKETFIEAWPRIKKYWQKIAPDSDFRDWWQTVYEQLLEAYASKITRVKGKAYPDFYGVGKQLKKMRVQKGISQQTLALRTKINQPDISMIEEGKKNITLQTLFKLCKILGIKKIEF